MARIFLCHASEDKAQVREVYHRLQAIDGLEPWLDEEDLLSGQDWTREIPRALQTSDFILIFFSRLSVAKRGYVQREMKLALDALQELPEGTIHTIPVRLDDCELPQSFQHYHYANLFDPHGFDRIVRAIRAEIAKRSGPTPPLSPQSGRWGNVPSADGGGVGVRGVRRYHDPLPERPLLPFLLLSGLLVAMVGLLIWQLPRIHQYGSRSVTFVIYVIVGLIAAVITFGFLRSIGNVRGQQLGMAFEFGGAAALFIVVLLLGMHFESASLSSFSVTLMLHEQGD